VLRPKSDSIIPCARVILAGIPVRFISLTARFLYFSMYDAASGAPPDGCTAGLVDLHEIRKTRNIMVRREYPILFIQNNF
jgi:hypothetical protein